VARLLPTRKAAMAVHLYRRHRVNCEGGHAEDSCSGEFDERRRGWKSCTCAIHASGILGGKFRRRTTGTTAWDEACAYARGREAADSWDPTFVALPVQLPASQPPATADAPATVKNRLAVTQACALFYESRDSQGLKPATLRKYRTFTKQITAYAESRGYVMVDQFTTSDIDRFWVT
jgi:hypothetical protein